MKIRQLVIAVLLVCVGSPCLLAQVVFREYLSQDHSGIVPNSVNFPGKDLEFEWEFISMEKGQFFAEGEAIQKILYRLNISADGKQAGSFDVQMRDLIVTFYIEISAVSEGESRTVTALYHKASRWVRLKGVLPTGCRQPENRWGRLDGVQSFDQLLQFVVRQLDRNIVFDCYFH